METRQIVNLSFLSLMNLLIVCPYSYFHQTHYARNGAGVNILTGGSGKISQLLSERGITFVVMPVNDQEIDGSFSVLQDQYNEVIVDYCAQKDILIFDPLPFLKAGASEEAIFRFKGNHHGSKEAHSLIGQELGVFLGHQEERLADRRPGEAVDQPADRNAPGDSPQLLLGKGA